MKKVFLIICFLSFYLFSDAQNQPEIGDELIVNEPSGQFYNHVSFPQLNILVKRGKIASYSPVYGNEVIVDEVIKKESNSTYVVLKKKDGSKFFGIISKVKANYTNALKSGELSLNN